MPYQLRSRRPIPLVADSDDEHMPEQLRPWLAAPPSQLSPITTRTLEAAPRDLKTPKASGANDRPHGFLYMEYDASQTCYTLKRKASNQLQPQKKICGDQTDFEALLGDDDFVQKLSIKNDWLKDYIKVTELQIAKDMGFAVPSPSLSAWITSQKVSKQPDLVSKREEHRLRADLETIATEYCAKTKLRSSTASFVPSLLPPLWKEHTTLAISLESFNANITALDLQKAHELLEAKGLGLIARAKEIEGGLKALGQSMV